MKLARCNEWMFRTVKCKGYMKKVNDGRFIDKDNIGNCTYIDNSKEKPEGEGWESQGDGLGWSKPVAEEDYDGSRLFLKRYYERTEKLFAGIVVGFKMVMETAFLVVDTEYHPYTGEYTVVRKEPEGRVKCAIVFYGCNKSRMVPIDMIEILPGAGVTADEEYKIYQKHVEKNMLEDIRMHVEGMCESGHISKEDKKKILKDEEVLQKMVFEADKRSDCNIAYNDTVIWAIEEVMKREGMEVH